jgi:hypothetical protein
MKNILQAMLILLCLSPAKGWASNLEVQIINKGDVLYFFVVNNGVEVIPVDSKIIIDRCGSNANLCFEVKDGTGKELVFTSHVRYSRDFSDTVKLNPGSIYGQEVDIDFIKKLYEKGGGKYTVKAIFNNKANGENATSSPLTLD